MEVSQEPWLDDQGRSTQVNSTWPPEWKTARNLRQWVSQVRSPIQPRKSAARPSRKVCRYSVSQFSGLWKNTTTWGSATQGNPWPEGDARKDLTLSALTNLVGQIS